MAELISTEEKSFVIKKAMIKDGFCNYKFEVISGVHTGDTHNVTGKALVKDDLHTAFSRLNVHVAIIDDVFKHSKIEVTDIESINNHELVGLYQVEGFEVKGSIDDESVILTYRKHVSEAGGWEEITTPKIVLDNLSSYSWTDDLRDAVNGAREEVYLYAFKGKCIPVEKDEPEDNPNQMTIDQNINEEEFEGAKVK